MESPTVLAKAFHSFRSNNPNIVKCFCAESMWGDPYSFLMTAYYNIETNQLIWTGFEGRWLHYEGDNVYTLYENGDKVIVGELIAKYIYEDDDYSALNKIQVSSLRNHKQWINN